MSVIEIGIMWDVRCILKRLVRVIGLAMLGLSLGQFAYAQTSTPTFRVNGLVIVWGANGPAPGGQAPVVSDFVINTGTGTTAAGSGDIDRIAADGFTVVTGSLTPTSAFDVDADGRPFLVRNIQGGGFNVDLNDDGVLNAADTFDAFRIRQGSNVVAPDINTSFYVASNTGFSIDAVASPLGSTTPDAFANIDLRLRITVQGDDGLAFGASAQRPHTGSNVTSGIRANNRSLADFQSGAPVFEGNLPTARLPGGIASQSVRFDTRYRFSQGIYDLSEGIIDAAAEVVYTVYVP